MTDTSRRKFLAATGAGVAGTVAVGGTAHAAAKPSADGAKDTVVAHVADQSSDQISLFVGEREVVLRDRDLVTRIRNAAGGR